MTDPMKPKTYRDIVFPNAAMTRLVDDLVTNRLVFPANGKNGLLIYGPNGTGTVSYTRLTLPTNREV